MTLQKKIIIGAIILIIVALVCWFIWKKNKKPTTDTTKTVAQPTRKQTLPEGDAYLVPETEYGPGGFLRIAENSADTGGFWGLSTTDQRTYLNKKGYKKV